jgi:hypothetical protein
MKSALVLLFVVAVATICLLKNPGDSRARSSNTRDGGRYLSYAPTRAPAQREPSEQDGHSPKLPEGANQENRPTHPRSAAYEPTSQEEAEVKAVWNPGYGRWINWATYLKLRNDYQKLLKSWQAELADDGDRASQAEMIEQIQDRIEQLREKSGRD